MVDEITLSQDQQAALSGLADRKEEFCSPRKVRSTTMVLRSLVQMGLAEQSIAKKTGLVYYRVTESGYGKIWYDWSAE